MERRVLGWTRAKVPVIGQGTWRMEFADRKACIEAIRVGIDLGATHIDTAEMYGAGEVEKIVGEAIKGRRDEVFLTSKVLPEHAGYADVLKSCEKSLKRLKTDRLDLYVLHWPGKAPFEETCRAFERLVKDGKIERWGVSNFDVQDLQMALEVAGEKKIACHHVVYHLQSRGVEQDIIPWCEKHQIPVVVNSPFGGGRFFPRPRTEGGKVLKEIADAHGVTPHQVALRFLVRRPLVFALPRAVQLPHVTDNAKAGDLQLTEEEIRRIDAAFPAGPGEEGILTM